MIYYYYRIIYYFYKPVYSVSENFIERKACINFILNVKVWLDDIEVEKNAFV